MTELLKSWVLLRARVQQTEGLPLSVEGQSQEFYMLRCGKGAAVSAAAPWPPYQSFLGVAKRPLLQRFHPQRPLCCLD